MSSAAGLYSRADGNRSEGGSGHAHPLPQFFHPVASPGFPPLPLAHGEAWGQLGTHGLTKRAKTGFWREAPPGSLTTARCLIGPPVATKAVSLPVDS
jgi:hypothetical protein